jgi:hypothetical protein
MEYSIKPKRLGERRIIHYPQKRIIGLYVINEVKKMLDFQTIAVDFDGTLCYSKWPELGQPNQALIEYLQEWKRNDNLPEIIEFYGHNSRKISCDYYIDDRMLLPENAKA